MKVKNLICFFIIFICLAVERVFIYFNEINSNPLFTNFLETQLFIFYLIICFWSIKKYGLFNLFTLFIFTLGLFNFMKIFYGLFFHDNYRDVASIIPIELTEKSIQETIWVFTLFIIIVSLSYSIWVNKIKIKQACSKVKSKDGWFYLFDKKTFVIGRAVMLFTFPFVLYRCYIEIVFFSGLSFTEIYIGGSQSIPIPSFIRVITVFYNVGFMMILGSRPSKKIFYIYINLYIISIFPYLIIGLRNQFALTILVLLWYYVKVYDARIKIWKIIIPVIISIIVLQLISINREGGELTTTVFALIPLFLTYQSTSMYVLALYIENRKVIMPHNYPYFLDPAIGWLTGVDGQSLEVLEKRSSLGHQMIYTLSPDAYLGGMSLGTSCIAELYEFGIIGIIIGGSIMAWGIAKFDLNIKTNRYYLLFAFFFCSYLLIAPRSTFLPNIYFLIRYLLVYCIIFLIWLIYKEIFKIKNVIEV